jgi:Tat protein secretion system quality control protein TatD with DNase activity
MTLVDHLNALSLVHCMKSGIKVVDIVQLFEEKDEEFDGCLHAVQEQMEDDDTVLDSQRLFGYGPWSNDQIKVLLEIVTDEIKSGEVGEFSVALRKRTYDQLYH